MSQPANPPSPLAIAVEQVEKKFGDEARRLFTQHLGEAVRAIQQEARHSVQSRLTVERETGRKESTAHWHKVIRQLRGAESLEDWRNRLMTAAAEITPRVALFAFDGQSWKLDETRGAHEPGAIACLGRPITGDAAPAFAQVAETLETVVALRSPSQLSDLVVGLYPDAPVNRCYLIPVLRQRRVAGLLLCVPETKPLDLVALELLVAIGSETLGNRVAPQQAPAGLIALGAPALPSSLAAPAAQEVIHREDHEAHLRAQRWARAQVSKLFLKHTDAILEARKAQNIFDIMREEIEADRRTYAEMFMKGSTTMPDFYHSELVTVLAGGNPDGLGPSYPGPLQ